MLTNNVNNAVYLYTLTQFKDIRKQDILKIMDNFASSEDLLNTSTDMVFQRLGDSIAKRLLNHLRYEFPLLIQKSKDIINKHTDKGISVITISDENYPQLLKLIADPPLILYVKGNIPILNNIDSIAVIGTRNPSLSGLNIARQVAKEFARNGFSIVSGLAKGIDTSAHIGALDVNGYTIAVLGTPLDKIYPAENKPLVEDILSNSGTILSELANGQSSFRGNFVQRDRIQSGLSVGIIPIQTDINGGTMHTVNFALQQKRIIFCPRPLDNEKKLTQYAGILSLIREGKAREFKSNEIDRVIKDLAIHKDLLSKTKANDIPIRREISPTISHREQIRFPLFDNNIRFENIDELEKYFHKFRYDSDPALFEDVISELRKRLFKK